MRILLIAIGTRGDVQPFIVLGRSLRASGHEVILASAAEFADASSAAGLSHRILPLDFDKAFKGPELGELFRDLSVLPNTYRWIREGMIEQLSAMWDIGLEVRPQLILHHFMGAAAPYLARHLGVVSVPVFLQPGLVPTSAYPQFLIASKTLGPVGNRFSHELVGFAERIGLSAMFHSWRKAKGVDVGPELNVMQGYNPQGRGMQLHAYSEAIVPRPADWSGRELQTGYFFDTPVPYRPSDELASFLAGTPQPIYCGFGSMPGIDEDGLATALSGALARTGLRAVVATGLGALGRLEPSANVHLLTEVPHSWLFARVAAVVHHGGSGTTHEGLRWGRPTVICPLFIDQPFFGQRVASLGAGPEPIWQTQLTADRLAKALELALEPQVRQRAAAIGAAMHGEDGAARVTELVDSGALLAATSPR